MLKAKALKFNPDIIITPNFSDTTGLKKWVVLTGNLIGVIVSLLIAFSLRSSL